MFKLIAPTLIACLYASSSFAACTYPLDATSSQVSMLGASPFSTQTSQGGYSTISTPVLSSINYAMMSGALFANFIAGSGQGDHALPTTGIVAFEYQITNFPNSKPVYPGELDSRLSILSEDTATQVSLSALLYLHSGFDDVATYPEAAHVSGLVAGGSYTFDANGNKVPAHSATPLPIYPTTLPLATNYRIGVYLNQDSRQLGLIVNGIDQGYVFTYDKPLKNIGFMLSSTLARLVSGDPINGQSVGGKLITDAPSMTLHYVAGAKDICGVAL